MQKKIFLISLILLLSFNLFSADDDEFKMVAQGGSQGSVSDIVFSSDGSMFATLSVYSEYINVWGREGKLLKRYHRGNLSGLNAIAFSDDGRYLAVSGITFLKIWNLKTDKEIHIDGRPGFGRNFYCLAFHPDNKHIITGTSMRIVTFIPLEIPYNDMESKYLSKIKDEKDKIKFKNIFRFDKKTNKYYLKIHYNDDVYKEVTDIVFDAKLKPDKVIVDDRRSLEMWDLEGKFVKEIAVHTRDIQRNVSKILITPDKQNIYSFGTDNVLKVWDFEGNLINTVDVDNPYQTTNIVFSSNSKYFGWAGYQSLKILNTNGIYLINKKIMCRDLNIDKKWVADNGYKLDKNNNTLSTVRIKDFNDNVLYESEIIPTSAIMKMSPDAKYVVSGGIEGTISIANIVKGTVVTLSHDKTGEWLAYTNDGYWAASADGGKLVAMVKGFEAYSVDQFALKYNRPDIILKRIGYEDDDLINFYYKKYLKRLKKFGLTVESLSDDLHVPEVKITDTKQNDKFVKLSFNASDSKYNLMKYNIYVNDVPVYGSLGKDFTGNNTNVIESVELTMGKNKIEVSCLNERGSESFRAITYAAYNKKTKGDLYFIGFGVSLYKNKTYNLKYADKDVKDLETLIKGFKNSYNKIITKTYLNKDVTVKNIQKAKEILKNAKVDDTVILFIAGHGLHDYDENNTYYFLTHEANAEKLSKTAAPFELIEDILMGIAPRNKIFLMDTCESGEFDDEDERNYYYIAETRKIKARSIRGLKKSTSKNTTSNKKRDYLFNKDRYIFNDLSRRSGSIVFSSSRGSEFSYEKDEYENGLFTEEIINAFIKGKADTNKDGFISTGELRKYVSKSVAEISDDLQHPTVDRDNIYQNIILPIVEEEDVPL